MQLHRRNHALVFLKGEDEPTSSLSHMIAPVFMSGSKSNSIRIPLSIWRQDGKIIGTHALLDSGATGCFISREAVARMKLPTRTLETPVRAWNVDGTLNQSGTIKQKTSVVLNYGGIRELRELMIFDCSKDEVILGLLWVRAVNPDINWNED